MSNYRWLSFRNFMAWLVLWLVGIAMVVAVIILANELMNTLSSS